MEGWVETVALSALDFAEKMEKIGIETVIYTDIARDGVLQGPNLKAIEQMAKNSNLQVIASGGVSSLKDLADLKALEADGVMGAVIGKALYDGKLDLVQALQIAESTNRKDV